MRAFQGLHRRQFVWWERHNPSTPPESVRAPPCCTLPATNQPAPLLLSAAWLCAEAACDACRAPQRMPLELVMKKQGDEDVPGDSLTASNPLGSGGRLPKRQRGAADAAPQEEQQKQQGGTNMHLRSAQKRLLAAEVAARTDSAVGSSQQLDRTDSCGGPRGGSADARTTAAAPPAPADERQAQQSRQQGAEEASARVPMPAVAAAEAEAPPAKRRRIARTGVPSAMPGYELRRNFDRPSPPFRQALIAALHGPVMRGLHAPAGNTATLPGTCKHSACCWGHRRSSPSPWHHPVRRLFWCTDFCCREDDENGHYQFDIGENLAPRFKIMRKFGEGTFGQVRLAGRPELPAMRLCSCCLGAGRLGAHLWGSTGSCGLIQTPPLPSSRCSSAGTASARTMWR
jgi:hypothetical protein